MQSELARGGRIARRPIEIAQKADAVAFDVSPQTFWAGRVADAQPQ